MQFFINDKVKWTSQAQGCTRTKIGTVIAVVPAKMNPRDLGFEKQLRDCGWWRQHESYIVEVFRNPKKGTGRKLYWPVVSGLKPYIGEQPV